MSEVKTENKNLKSKLIKVIITILAVLLALALCVIIGARIYFRAPAKEYYKHSEKAFKIPDIDNGFIPQGIVYNDTDQYFLLTGYMKDDSASPIYIVDRNGQLISAATICNADGNTFACHAGGISIYKDYVYVAGCQDCALYIYSYEDIKNGGSVDLVGTFSTKVSDDDYLNIDCTTIYDGKIILGEFFREENYQTLPSHKLTTNAGDYKQALAVAFELGDYDETYGINPEPIYALTLPDKCQGMAINDGLFYTSSSYGAASSSIEAYSIEEANNSNINILGVQNIPLYELDSSCQKTAYVLPPMSEEIEFVDGRFYTMCESASNKYFFGKLTSHKHCYSTELY